MNWLHLWSRDYGVQYCEVALTCFSKGPSVISIVKNHLIYPKQGNQGYYVREDDFKNAMNAIDNCANSKDCIESEINGLKTLGKEYFETAMRISKMDLKLIENSQLLELYKEYREIWALYSSHLASTYYINERVTEKVDSLLNNFSTEIRNKILEFATTPIKQASIMKLNKELDEYKKSNDSKILEKILEEYKWIPCLDIHQKPWSSKDIEQYSNDHILLEDKNLISEDEVRKSLSSENFELVNLSRELVYVKDLRDEYRRKSTYLIQTLYLEISNRMGLTLEDISYTRDLEIVEFLTKGIKPNKEIIDKRKNGFLMFESNGSFECVVGEIENKARNLGLNFSKDQKNEIIGRAASSGVISGRVKIVLTVKDLKKVETGDILVAVTTGPDYVPAMKKAGAIVTDEGGITSHAAIVAREMKKPCVVGTKNATHILNDGDFIEVNADSGIIRKLEN